MIESASDENSNLVEVSIRFPNDAYIVKFSEFMLAFPLTRLADFSAQHKGDRKLKP